MPETSSGSLASASIRAWYGLCWGVFVLVFVSIAFSGGLGTALFGGAGVLVSSALLWRGVSLRLRWDDDGLTIRNALRTRVVPWAEVRGARSAGIGTNVVTLFKAAAIDTAGRAITVEGSGCFKWRKPPKDTAAAVVDNIESELRRRQS